MAKAARVVIYVPGSREWYRKPGLGLTPDATKAHRYSRSAAEAMVGTDAQVEIHEAPAVLAKRNVT